MNHRRLSASMAVDDINNGMLYNSMRFVIFSIVFSVVLLFLESCSVSYPPCIHTERDKHQVIRWGDVHEDQTIEGYQLNADATLMKFQQKTWSDAPVMTKIGKITPEQYCSLLRTVRLAFLEVQALNAPGKQESFVEYTNPANALALQALWNSEFRNKGNEKFRAVTDSLETARMTAN